MLSRVLVPILVLLAACSGGSSSKPAPAAPIAPPAPPGPPASPPEDPAAAAHRAALAEVATLIAQADKDPLLTPWTGPYGGVPPWDRVQAAAFPAAFQLGMAVR